jgi:peptide/nickel transport system substrate-binding protein
MWGEYWSQSQFDSVIVGLVFTSGIDPDVTARFHSGSIPAQGGKGSNNAQYKNPDFDKLLEEGVKIFDPAARKEIYLKTQEIIRDDLVILPIFQYATVRGRKKGIEGVVPNINVKIDTWNTAAYYWDK